MLNNIHLLGKSAGQTLFGLLVSRQYEVPSIDVSALVRGIASFPTMYREWWVKLLYNDPAHVVIESMLLVSILYMFYINNRYSSKTKSFLTKEKLTEQETQELLTDWRNSGRAGLVPAKTTASNDGKKTDTASLALNSMVVVKSDGARMVVRNRNGGSESKDQTVLNFATHDFLGMSALDGTTTNTTSATDSSESGTKSNNPVKEASREALGRYGCGSCGPRGFYGTIDAHLELEDAISKFTHTEGAIMYSDGASASTSTVAAFAKRGDLLVVDEGIYEALGSGVTLSRATVKWFRHNDMEDLRRVLERIQVMDQKLKRKSSDQRRFIVVEGLYKNSGRIAPLDELATLKAEFNYRLMVDESCSFGTLGKTGRGVLEMYDRRPMEHAEIVTISLENALGSIGAVCVGNEEVVDHQRLSGAGYCFSASAPPFVASAAIAALNRLQNEPSILAQLKSNVSYMYQQLRNNVILCNWLVVTSDDLSPLVFLQCKKIEGHILTRDEQVMAFEKIAGECLTNGVALVSTGRHVIDHIHKIPPPALRMTISAAHTKADLDKALAVLTDAVSNVAGAYSVEKK